MITLNPIALVIAGANLYAGMGLLIRGLRAQRTGRTALRRKGDFIVTGLRLPISGTLANNVGRFWTVHGAIMIVGGLISFLRLEVGFVSLFGGAAVFLIHDFIIRAHNHSDHDQSG